MNNEIINIANKQVKKSILSSILISIFFISIIIIFKIYILSPVTIGSTIFIILDFKATFELIVKVKNIKKTLTLIELEKINIEINNYIFKRPDCILTENYFIVCSRADFEILKYTDIVMIYYKTIISRTLDTTLNITTKSNKKYCFTINTFSLINENKIKDFSHILTTKNPNILVGKKQRKY